MGLVGSLCIAVLCRSWGLVVGIAQFHRLVSGSTPLLVRFIFPLLIAVIVLGRGPLVVLGWLSCQAVVSFNLSMRLLAWNEILNLMSLIPGCHVAWIHRGANKAAHSLAKWSFVNNVFGSFDVGFGPSCFELIIKEEVAAYSLAKWSFVNNVFGSFDVGFGPSCFELIIKEEALVSSFVVLFVL